jgi:heme A synthase
MQPTTGAGTAPATAPAPVVPSGDTYANVAAGLASLDFRLPERGRMYSFTTQRGLIDISARPVSLSLLSRLGGLAVLAAVVLLVWAATRAPARAAYSRLFSTVACGVLLAVLGILSLITGIFPVLGLVMIVAGIVLAIRNRVTPTPVAATN